MTRFAWGAASDTGRVRTGNEDFVLAAGKLFAVADGMGGHSGGEIASHLAIETVMRIYDEGGRHTTDALVEAVQLANDALVARAIVEPDLKGMGTTLCAMALVDGADQPVIGVINVGDSRLYLLKKGELEQITEDHSLVATLERQGRLSKAEAAVHPQRNIITRALGIDQKVMVDSWEIVPFTGDRYLVCSDGLFNEVDDAKIAATLRRLADPSEAAHELVRLANEGGGRDNISCVVVDVIDDDHRSHPDESRVAAAVPGSDRVLHTVLAPRRDLALDARPDPASSGDLVDLVGPPAGRRKILTWRLVLFFVALFLVIGATVLAIVYVGTSTYYVGLDNDEVVIFRGKPGGVLWIQPELHEDTQVSRRQVPPALIAELERGKEQSTLDDAHRYVANLKQQVDALKPPPTTTTTASTTTTLPTTSLPPPAETPVGEVTPP